MFFIKEMFPCTRVEANIFRSGMPPAAAPFTIGMGGNCKKKTGKTVYVLYKR
jgi:hypothetical protein